ncbi:MAG: hypothetical protein V1722_01875 [Candidatus Micrarchaeota archaeon]
MELKFAVFFISVIGLASLFFVSSFTGYATATSQLTVTADLFAGDGNGISTNCAIAKQNNGVDHPSDYDLTDGNDWMLLCLKTSVRANCVIDSIEDRWIVAGYDRMQIAPYKLFNANFSTDGTAGYQYRVKFRNNPNRGEYNLITAFNQLRDYDTINIKCTPTNGGATVKIAKTRVNKLGFLELFCNPGIGQGDCDWAQTNYITNECYGECNSCRAGYTFVAWWNVGRHSYISCRRS